MPGDRRFGVLVQVFVSDFGMLCVGVFSFWPIRVAGFLGDVLRAGRISRRSLLRSWVNGKG
jgi:hypothetical protein